MASPDRTSAATVLDPSTQIKSRARPMSKPTATTPLLTDSLQNVEYHAYHERKHMPLPLMCVARFGQDTHDSRRTLA